MNRIRLSWTGESKSNQFEQAQKAHKAQTNAISTPSNDSLESKNIRLPGEIWDMIWCLIIDSTAPRIVEIRSKQIKRNTIFTSPSPIPLILQICSRSRALALRRWKLCLATKGECPKIFFDYETDVLYFGKYFKSVKLFKEQVSEEDRKKIKSTGLVSSTLYMDGQVARAMYLDMLGSKESGGKQLRILNTDEHLIPP